jgi:hydroxymethylbilane synthase
MAQAREVAEGLRLRGGVDVELVEVTTHGDSSADALTAIGGTGVFASALRERLLGGDVELAVHSLKDLPTAPVDGLTLAAVPRRADPRDALVTCDGRPLDGLADGAVVGTGSPRRAAQLRALGRGFQVVAIRGNVDSRVRRVTEGELDAVVLAAAGLARLGAASGQGQPIAPDQLLPAPGQGALAVECAAADERLAAELRDTLDDPPARIAVTAERALLAALKGGCTAPVGALTDVDAAEIHLRAVVASADGARVLRMSATGPVADPSALGCRLAADLLAAGANELMEEPS